MNQAYCPYCMTPVKPGEPCPNCGLTEGSYHSQPHHLPPGTVLADRYLLGRVLGEGGFGITYIGCDTRLELRVAVKEYYPGNHVTRNCAVSPAVTCFDGVAGRGFEKGRERFIREARTMARMDKTPQIVAVRDFFQENDTAYIVMEYVDGTTFKELVAQKGGKLSAGELLPLLQPLFGALSTMHSQGLIHRDISPDNLMLENGMVRLLDFGCARESEKGNETMTIVLKQGYSPVEQYQHKGQGAWTDVYSLAATIYYCLTGQTPPQALDRICDDELIPPRKLGADLTREQELALLYGMGLQPTRRFRSVQEFYAALYQGAPVPLVPTPPEPDDPTPPEPDDPTPPEPDDPTPPGLDDPTPPGPDDPTPPAPDDPTPPEPDDPTPPKPDDPTPPEKPDRKKWFLIGGAAAAAALILALVLIIPRLTGSSGPGSPAAEGSGTPAPSMEPPPEDLFNGAPTAANAGEFLKLLADDSVSAIIISEGETVTIGATIAGTVEIAKPVRLGKNASLNVNGSLTISSQLVLLSGAWLDQSADFTLTESGALYIGTGNDHRDSYAHVGNLGTGRCDISGTVQVPRDGDFNAGGETVSLSGTVLIEGTCAFNGKTTVSGDILVTGNSNTWFGGETDVTGTMQVAEGCNIWLNSFTTVSGEGRISADGFIYSHHVLKTADGGSVTVGDSGRIELNVLWLEKNTDLNAARDHLGLDQVRYIVVDEKGPFENATHVNSFRELEQAVNDRLVSAIVIDSGFEMEYGLIVNKPVLIREGVELSTGIVDNQPIFNGVTVNYGSVTGFMAFDGQCVYLNYGATDVSVYANGGINYILNMGDLNLQHGQYIGGAIVNLGRMRHEIYGGDDEIYLDLAGTMVENLGEITVCSGNRVKLAEGGYFENNGELLIENNAWLESSTHVNSGGLLRVRGTLDNHGGILDIGNPSRLSMEGGRVDSGIIQTWADGSALEGNENITSQVLVLREEPSSFVEVSNTEEFRAELNAGGTKAIRVTGSVTLSGSTELGRPLIIDSGASLTAVNLTVVGPVYVYGELRTSGLTVRDGQLQLMGGGVMETGALTLENSDGALWGSLTESSLFLNNARLINWDHMLQRGNLTANDGRSSTVQQGALTLDGGSDFYNRGELVLTGNVSIAVNSGTFADLSWLEMPGGSITVGESGAMLLRSGAHLYDGVAVTNRGGFDVANCEFNLDGGASIVNHGHLGFYHWAWQFVGFGGEITNRGYMFLSGGERVDGVLTNYGELEISHNGSVIQINGQLNNNGTAFAYNHNAGWQGNWTGRALEYR